MGVEGMATILTRTRENVVLVREKCGRLELTYAYKIKDETTERDRRDIREDQWMDN